MCRLITDPYETTQVYIFSSCLILAPVPGKREITYPSFKVRKIFKWTECLWVCRGVEQRRNDVTKSGFYRWRDQPPSGAGIPHPPPCSCLIPTLPQTPLHLQTPNPPTHHLSTPDLPSPLRSSDKLYRCVCDKDQGEHKSSRKCDATTTHRHVTPFMSCDARLLNILFEGWGGTFWMVYVSFATSTDVCIWELIEV